MACAAAACLMAGLAGCYDDQELRSQLEDQERRLAALDQACAQMNTNIASLQLILNALQENDYISSTAPIVQDGKIIGYTLTFNKRGVVTLYQGQDGANGKKGADGRNGKDGKDGRDGIDGAVPVIGVRQHADGCWYWTLDGDWLLDAQGARVKAVGIDGQNGKDGKDGQDGKDGKDGVDGQNGQDGVNGQNGQDGQNGKDGKDGVNGQDGKDGQNGQDGKDGKDGVTPQLKIENNYWYITFDEGQTWTGISRATGRNGQNGRDGANGTDGANGDAMFLSVDTSNPDYVTITLQGVGTPLVIPREKQLSIWFEADTVIIPKNYDAVHLQYAVTSSSPNDSVAVDVVASGGVKALVVPNAAAPQTGEIVIASPAESFSEETKILVLVSNGSHMIMRTLHLKEAYLTCISADTYHLNPAEQELELWYRSNIPGLQVVVQSSGSWCLLKGVLPKTDPDDPGVIDSVAVLSIDSLKLGMPEREAIVTVESGFSGLSLTFTITQSPSAEAISFQSDNVKSALCAAVNEKGEKLIDKNNDGEISYYEASLVEDVKTLEKALGSQLYQGTTTFSFNEFKYFGAITELPKGSFNNWTALESISMPEGITKVGGTVGVDTTGVFQNCPSLKYFDDKDYWVQDDVLYKVAEVLTSEREERFEIPDGVKIVGLRAFYRSKVRHVDFPNSLRTIRDKAFEYSQIEDIVFPCEGDYETGEAYVDSISESAFNHCFKLRSFIGPNGPKKPHKIRVLSHRGVYQDTVMLAFALASDGDTFSIPVSLDIRKLAYGLFSMEGGGTEGIPLEKLGLPNTISHIGPHAFSRQKNMDVYFYYPEESWQDTTVVRPPEIVEGGAFDHIDKYCNFYFYVPGTGDELENQRRNILFHDKLSKSVPIKFYDKWPF